MPWDIDAEVIGNRRLSADYNVLSLAAPDIAAATEPGQFVMVKPGHGWRPAPAPAVLGVRDPPRLDRRAVGRQHPEQADRRHDAALSMPRRRTARAAASDRSAGRSRCRTRPTEAWMVAGGVGLAPFVDARRSARAAAASR